MLTWYWPLAFLLLPLPWLFRQYAPAKSRPRPALRLPSFDTARQANRETGALAPGWRTAVAWAAWVLLVSAAARPAWFGEPETLPTAGRDLMLAVDLSDSMLVEDMVAGDEMIDRLSAVKAVVNDFIDRRTQDRIGLILFGQHTFLQTPLTFDRRTVAIQLNESQAGFAGSSTAIGDAIAMAIKKLKDRASEGRVLVLLTDGENTSGADPMSAARIAAQAGIRIHTIGIGATSLTVRDVTGSERRINPSNNLDQNTLQAIATTTGGQAFRAHDPTEIARVYTIIDQLEPTPQPVYYRPQRSLLHWPLLMSLLLFTALLPSRTRLVTS